MTDGMNGPYLIGLDVGTTSVKGGLFAADGAALKRYTSAYSTRRPRSGLAEQAPDDWMTRVHDALETFLAGTSTTAIAGLGLCSQVNTHVFVDEKGEPLTPAIVWQDGRAAEEARALDRRVAREDRLAWWGAPLPLDASHVLSRMAWVRKNHPDLWRRTRWVMAPKDYCLFRLTGEVMADPLSSFGIVDRTLKYIPDLIGLVEGAAQRLPPLASMTSTVGRVRADLPGAGLPAVAGTMDAWAGMIGAGVVRNGEGGYLSGTSEVGGIVSSGRIPTPGVIAFPECEGIILHAGPTQAGGAAVAWLARLLGCDPEDVAALAAKADPQRPAPTFLPHLDGERAPIWDIYARASFAGLDASMGAPELARAVLEGVAYSVRLLWEALESSAGCAPSKLHHAGGGARSDLWCQIRADALNRVVERKADRDAGVLGAAMLAGVGTGLYPSIGAAAGSLVRADRVFEPNERLRARYDEGFGRYKALYERLNGFGR
jgi:xylulokinase